MHEFSLCRGLLQQVMQISEAHQAQAVKSIHLKIGALAGIEVELLRRAFPIVAQGTTAQHATLEITTLAATVLCTECGQTSVIKQHRLTCHHCKNRATQLLCGDELRLENIIIKQPRNNEQHDVQ